MVAVLLLGTSRGCWRRWAWNSRSKACCCSSTWLCPQAMPWWLAADSAAAAPWPCSWCRDGASHAAALGKRPAGAAQRQCARWRRAAQACQCVPALLLANARCPCASSAGPARCFTLLLPPRCCASKVVPTPSTRELLPNCRRGEHWRPSCGSRRLSPLLLPRPHARRLRAAPSGCPHRGGRRGAAAPAAPSRSMSRAIALCSCAEPLRRAKEAPLSSGLRSHRHADAGLQADGHLLSALHRMPRVQRSVTALVLLGRGHHHAIERAGHDRLHKVSPAEERQRARACPMAPKVWK